MAANSASDRQDRTTAKARVQLKRTAPSADTLTWRRRTLETYATLTPMADRDTVAGLANGNRKTGVTGSLYKTVFVWNLPPVVTCPGASITCREVCYNADPRADVFPIRNWTRNWDDVLRRAEDLRERIVAQLSTAKGPVAVRLHSAGDFFSADYIRFWTSIIAATPDVSYWAYTRSWAVPTLIAPLESLRRLPNIQLFASIDTTMPEPPVDWRLSWLLPDLEAAQAQEEKPRGLICPEQIGLLPNCASCGYCIRRRGGDVYFTLH